MRDIDLGVFFFLHGFMGRWPEFDNFVNLLTDNDMLKAAPVLIAIWALWFLRDPAAQERRARIVALLLTSCAAALFSVWLTRVLPVRLRPVFEPTLSFAFTVKEGTPDWSRVSSLPSDHAAMFVALACGLLFISRRWGWPILIHAVLCIMLPRAMIGLHYFWDLMAGAAIGVAFACIGNTEFIRARLARPIASLEVAYPSAFYALLFLLSFQIADLFHSTRQILSVASHMASAVIRGARAEFGATPGTPIILMIALGLLLTIVVLRRRRPD